MIWHDAIPKDAHRHPGTGQANQVHEDLVVAALMEYFVPRVAAIDNVIADVSD
jgi:hypothetical protein